MKLTKGVAKYKVGPIGTFPRAAMVIGGTLRVLPQVSPEWLLRYARPEPASAAIPTHFCIHQGFQRDEIEFIPPPDNDYDVSLRYYPPMVEE